ncbi:protein FAMb; protein FAMa [Trichuris trichiura]|uniref:Ubiquitin carboxyl-terminal hydrolase n=1 Tax=Trichuris trichiura TaxID=36087 RepID=A0A077Z2F1_TRITR|nr:protein FAMb; protein FAMa [Trichuris trichiura]
MPDVDDSDKSETNCNRNENMLLPNEPSVPSSSAKHFEQPVACSTTPPSVENNEPSASSSFVDPPDKQTAHEADEPYVVNLIHQVKWVKWYNRPVPIATQNENGPCPLLAICNLLLLRGDLTLPEDTEVVAATQLINMVGDLVFQQGMAKQRHRLDYEQNVYDAMSVLPKLSTGLDVNVKFKGAFEFEYTPECIIFDLLNITLCHGWISDPTNTEMHQAVGNLSYNQLVEKIIHEDASKSTQGSYPPSFISLFYSFRSGLYALAFFDSSVSQLTRYGLASLRNALQEGHLAVLFRNNHFSVITKRNGSLYLLVTDQGFLKEPNYVWETLDSIDGNSHFVDSDFFLVPAKTESSVQNEASPQQTMKQVENDFLLALSLEESGPANDQTADQLLAAKLQEEEQRAAAAAAAAAAATPPQRRERPVSRPEFATTSHATNYQSKEKVG